MEVRNTSSKYMPTLIAVMSFIDGVKYDATSSFSHDTLLAITADQVAAYLNYKAYGMPTPGPTDRPTQGRSNSLAFHKKAISHFMPQHHEQKMEVCNTSSKYTSTLIAFSCPSSTE